MGRRSGSVSHAMIAGIARPGLNGGLAGHLLAQEAHHQAHRRHARHLVAAALRRVGSRVSTVGIASSSRMMLTSGW